MAPSLSFERLGVQSAILTADSDVNVAVAEAKTRFVVTRFIHSQFLVTAVGITIVTIESAATVLMRIYQVNSTVIDLSDLELKCAPEETLSVVINYTATTILGSYYIEYEKRGG